MLTCYSASSLKQPSADRHVTPLEHMILIPNSLIKGGDFFVLNSIKDWNTLRNNIKAINDHDASNAAVKQHMKNT
jgi:hypothetical protein